MDLTQLTGVGLITFGGVWFIDLVLTKFLKRSLDSVEKFIAAVVIALVWSFVPANLGMDIANRLKDAISIATAMAGAYQFGSKIAEKV